MKAKKGSRMGRPPLPPDRARPIRYTVSITVRDQALLDRYAQYRPHLTKAACMRELAHFMLEIINNPTLGTDYVMEQLGLTEEEDSNQIELNFDDPPVVRDQMKVFRDGPMDRLITNSKPPLIPQ